MECGDLSPLSRPATRRRTSAPQRAPVEANPRLEMNASSGSFSEPSSEVSSPLHLKPWPHAPTHEFTPGNIYFVTAATLHHEHFFNTPARLDLLEHRLLTLTQRYHWQLEAWAVFSNHYHFVARTAPDSAPTSRLCRHLHADTSRAVNRLDGVEGRKVWFNFRETALTFQKSYLARLNYTHQNAVRHGLVPVSNQYRWCSAAWFERECQPATVKTIYGFKTDQLELDDDFAPIVEGWSATPSGVR
jgi:putative transposase